VAEAGQVTSSTLARRIAAGVQGADVSVSRPRWVQQLFEIRVR
jgi:hypothetical protein